MKIKEIEALLNSGLDVSVLRHFETFDAELSKSQWAEKYVLKIFPNGNIKNTLTEAAIIAKCAYTFGLETPGIWAAPNVYHFTK